MTLLGCRVFFVWGDWIGGRGVRRELALGLGFRVLTRSPGWHLDQVFLFNQMYGARTWRVKTMIVCFGWVGAGLEMVILIGVV